MKLGLILASRGLMHSRTVEGIIENLKSFEGEWQIFWSHDNPIPDCFNIPVKAALDWGAEKIWVVEEDMEIPAGTLDKLLSSKEKVVAMDYAVAIDVSTIGRDAEGELMYTGMGCILIDREVLEKMGHPYFRSNIDYLLPDWRENEVAPWNVGYGRQDIDFGIRTTRKLGYKIEVMGEIGHYKVKEMGGPDNNGFHKIEKWTVKRTHESL